MNIIRSASTLAPWAQIPHALLADERISWKAKGVLAYLCSKPEGWETRVADLRKRGADGEFAIRAALNELRAAGYAQFTRVRENGKIASGRWEISNEPVFVAVSSTKETATYSKKEFSKNENTKGVSKTTSAQMRTMNLTTEDDIYNFMDTLGLTPDPDHDGQFAHHLLSNNFTLSGVEINDLAAAYRARVAHILSSIQ